MMNARAVAWLCALTLAACGGSSEPAATPSPSASAVPVGTPSAEATKTATPAPARLPGGGTTIFPRSRVVAFYGAAGVPGLGVLGQGSPDVVAQKLLAQAHAYAPFGRPVLPAFELIATVAQQAAGASGNYSANADDATIATYLAAARRMHGLLILDIQPGYRSFASEARHYEKYLVQPDVGLALDSEWSMSRGEIPGKTIGHTTAAVVNDVSSYLAGLVKAHGLPQKLLVIHLFTPFMVVGAGEILPRPGLAITFHIDGFGSRALKRVPYHGLHRKAPFFNGFKLFYKQDTDMFAPADVMGLRPQPDLITYE
jgi:hypothetical protein